MEPKVINKNLEQPAEDQIVKSIHIDAPKDAVWDALTNSRHFGHWFKADTSGEFEPGEVVHCVSTYPGHEGAAWNMRIKDKQPKDRFTWAWPIGGPDDEMEDLDKAQLGQVEFLLHEIDGGTRLTLTEKGFGDLPPETAAKAHRNNSDGWEKQLQNIKKFTEHG